MVSCDHCSDSQWLNASYSFYCWNENFLQINQMSHLASNFPILVEVVVTSMASCPPPITTWITHEWNKPRAEGENRLPPWLICSLAPSVFCREIVHARSQVVTRRLKSSFCCDLYGPPCFWSWSGIDHLSPASVNKCPLTWSMMGEMAAELTGLSVLKVLMWSRDEQSNSWKEMGKSKIQQLTLILTTWHSKMNEFLVSQSVSGLPPWRCCPWRRWWTWWGPLRSGCRWCAWSAPWLSSGSPQTANQWHTHTHTSHTAVSDFSYFSFPSERSAFAASAPSQLHLGADLVDLSVLVSGDHKLPQRPPHGTGDLVIVEG